MLAPTHLVFNHTLYLGVSLLLDHPVTVPEVIALTLVSPLPDIDTSTSLLGKCCPPISRYLEREHGHRTLTHSVWVLGAIALFASPFLWWNHWVYIAILAGFFFHVAGDTFTKMGPMFFYPHSQIRFVSLIPEYRFVTGSSQEKVLMGILACSTLALYSIQGPGVIHVLEALLGNVKLEREQFQAQTKAEFQYAKPELDKMLAEGIIDRQEYNQQLEEWKLTWIEAGKSPEEVRQMMKGDETTRTSSGADILMTQKTESWNQLCLAEVARKDEMWTYVWTSPTCINGVSPLEDGSYPLRLNSVHKTGEELTLLCSQKACRLSDTL